MTISFSRRHGVYNSIYIIHETVSIIECPVLCAQERGPMSSFVGPILSCTQNLGAHIKCSYRRTLAIDPRFVGQIGVKREETRIQLFPPPES